jgi:hypothetical protein
MYKIIDKNLGIATCSIADLTVQQVSLFLSKWKDGTSIGQLISFYDKEKDLFVLNRDNEEFERYLRMSIKYMGMSAERREYVKANISEAGKEVIQSIDGVITYRTTKKEIYRARFNLVHDEAFPILNDLAKYPNQPEAVTLAYRYGVMQGKREERARRRKANG